MGEYITGTTNQGGTIGSSTLPIREFNVDTLTADTINYTTLNPSVISLIDDVTIIKNSSGEIEVNPDLTLTGDVTTGGWLYVKGKNRLYQQNLTAATTTSTTATLLGTALSITPAFSGYIVINAILRVNNNTVGDGVTVSLLNGTTILDTETYIQEGLASNSHTIFLHYELSGQTIGTALSLSLNFNAVTGGTASAKIVAFDAKEI